MRRNIIETDFDLLIFLRRLSIHTSAVCNLNLIVYDKSTYGRNRTVVHLLLQRIVRRIQKTDQCFSRRERLNNRYVYYRCMDACAYVLDGSCTQTRHAKR